MTTNGSAQKAPGSRLIGLSCTYVVIPATSKKTLAEESTASLLAKQDRRARLAGQQRRTLRKKKQFLEIYPEQGHFMIALTCKIVGIKSRKTVYNWIKNDPDFKEAMEGVANIQRDFVNDLLMALIAKGDGSSIRYFLDRRHPDYKRGKKGEDEGEVCNFGGP